MAARKKDPCRDAVYNGVDELVPDRQLPTTSPCEDFINLILASRYWKDHAPIKFHSLRIVRRSRSKVSYADVKRRAIYMRACYPVMVCHEMAHFLVPDWCEEHGPEFLYYYQALGNRFLPPKTAASLRRHIAATGRPVAKRPVRRGPRPA